MTVPQKKMLKYFIGQTLYNFDIKRRRKSANAECKDITTTLRIRYLEAGSNHQKTVVILHGFSDSKDSFASIIKRLKNRYRVIVPDLPGFGESDTPSETYSLDQYTTWISDFVRALNISCCHLIGHSLGGAICTTIAVNNPQWLKSIAIISGGGVQPEKPVGVYKVLEEGYNPFCMTSYQEFEKFLQMNFYRLPYMPGSVKHFVFHRYLEYGKWYDKIMKDLTDYHNPQREDLQIINDKLQLLKHPTLIVWGQEDQVLPVEIGELIHSLVPDSQFHVLPKIGHGVNLEGPGPFCKIYQKFLAQL